MITADSEIGWQGEIRRAGVGDADSVASLAAELAMSFQFSAESFRASYPALLAADGARLLLAVNGRECHGYLLGFRHLTFYANGPVGWVEEIIVRQRHRGQSIGRALMNAFEQWAAVRGARWSRWLPAGRHRSTTLWGMRNPPPIFARYRSTRRGPDHRWSSGGEQVGEFLEVDLAAQAIPGFHASAGTIFISSPSPGVIIQPQVNSRPVPTYVPERERARTPGRG
jgi:GNAT superfamily N-acetyltransferase